MIGHRVVLRPRSLLETGDLALVFMRDHAKLFAQLLPWVLFAALPPYLLHRFADWPEEAVDILELGLLGLFSGVYTHLCGDLMLAPQTSLKGLQRRFLKQLPGYLVTRIAGWAVLLLTLGFGYRLTAFLPESALLERGGLSPSFTRSNALLRATPGRAIGLGILTLILLSTGAFGMELARLAVRSLFSIPGEGFLSVRDSMTWASFLGMALMAPYVATLRFLLYIDCRTRREGWDLQVQFSSLVTAGQSQLRHKVSTEAA